MYPKPQGWCPYKKRKQRHMRRGHKEEEVGLQVSVYKPRIAGRAQRWREMGDNFHSEPPGGTSLLIGDLRPLTSGQRENRLSF